MRLLRFQRSDLCVEPRHAVRLDLGSGAAEAVIARLPYYGLAALQRALIAGVWVSPIPVQQALAIPQLRRCRLATPRHWAKPLKFTNSERHLRFWLRVDRKQVALPVRERCWWRLCESVTRHDRVVRWAICGVGSG